MSAAIARKQFILIMALGEKIQKERGKKDKKGGKIDKILCQDRLGHNKFVGIRIDHSKPERCKAVSSYRMCVCVRVCVMSCSGVSMQNI
jgi:hypothetical protein